MGVEGAPVLCLGVQQRSGLHAAWPVASHPQHLLVAVLSAAGARHPRPRPGEVCLVPLGIPGAGAGGGGGHTLLARVVILII